MRIRSFRFCFFVVMLLPTFAAATTRTWPGVAPCAGTLQACVTGAVNGDRIEIATAAPIAEDISLYDRSLTVTAANGFAPAFGNGHWLAITSSGIAGDLNVSVSHLSFTDGYVFANYNGVGTATYDFEELALTRAISNSSNYVEIDANSGTIIATLYHNRVIGVPRSPSNGLIQLNSAGATLNAAAYYNHISSTSTAGVPGAGVFVDVHANGSTAGGGTFKLHGNEVRGEFNLAGIFVSEGLLTSAVSAVTARVYNNVSICADAGATGTGTGIGFVANNGSIDAQAFNNTVSRCHVGVLASRWVGGTSASISGSLENNLIVAYDGLSFVAAATGSLGNDYNLFNTTVSGTAYGIHTIVTPARLVLDTQPRLRPDSPAIDAADNLTLALSLAFNGLPTNDADGLRRFKGASGGSADIGAYESGDVSFTHTTRSNTIGGDATVIDNAALNGNAGAALIATPNYNIGLAFGVDYNHPFGTYYPSPDWDLFNQDFANVMPLGAHFDVFVPASGG